jgi:hypothetical protein
MSDANTQRARTGGPSGHGRQKPVPIDAALADDPALWLVTADLAAWSAAHPCECEALCRCDHSR